MPCYNSLAADRHADEEGRQAALDIQAEQARDQLIESFNNGEDTEHLQFDDIMEEFLSGWYIHHLIKAAWTVGIYRELGEDIHRELIRLAEIRADAAKPDLRTELERGGSAGEGDDEIPQRGSP